jgi:hypothetical protein
MGLAIDWFRKISNQEDKKATEQAIRQAGGVLEILKDLLETRLRSISKTNEDDYDSPSWAYLQAHKNGRIQDLEYVIRLLTL